MSKNSVLEQALLQVKTLEDAVKQNAKGILESTMKQELTDLLKEQAEEEEVTKLEEEEEENVSEQEAFGSDEEEEDDDAEDTGLDTDDEEGDEFGADMGDEADEEGDEFGGEDLDTDDEEEDMLDLTGASDSEVLKVFKAMKPEDGIVVKKDGNKLEVNTGTDEFIIKLNDEEVAPEVDEEGSDEEESFDAEDGSDEEGFGSDEDETGSEEEVGFGSEEDETGSEEDEDETSELAEEEEENVYEIEIDEEEECDECDKKLPEEEVDEAARTKWNPHGDKGGMNRAGLKSKKVFKAGSGQMNEEVEKLKKQNAEYKKALVLFKEKLNEVAVFNANLAYATRLFTEQSTTKQEKLNILKRFDSISTLTESKNLYKTIQTELSNKKTVTESVAEKISSTPTSSVSKEVLSESKAYENPQFARMKELMKKVK